MRVMNTSKTKVNRIFSTRSWINNDSDIFGAAASSLCLIHCLITPLLFVVQASAHSCSESSPIWWRMVDYVFLVISFWAIHSTAKYTVLKWMPTVLYLTWVLLALMILNGAFEFFALPHYLLYIPALGLTFLHLYNRNFCQCANEECCSNNLISKENSTDRIKIQLKK